MAEKIRTSESFAHLVRGKWFLGEGDQIKALVRTQQAGLMVLEPIVGSVKAVRYRSKNGYGKIVYVRPNSIEAAVPIEDSLISSLTISTKRNSV